MTLRSWDQEYDLVVLGSGGAGLTAAITAAVTGATVGVFEKAETIGGTTAVSGGIIWVPAHERVPGLDLPVEDAIQYLRAQSLGVMNDSLVATYVLTAPRMAEFIETHTPVRFAVADSYADYKPELPGGKPGGGRSLTPLPFDVAPLGEWADRITAFPLDFGNVGFDAETRGKLNPELVIDEPDVSMFYDVRRRASSGGQRVGGQALIGGLLHGLIGLGVEPQVSSRAVELVADSGRITGVCIQQRDKVVRVGARCGVVIATGGFEWDRDLVRAFLRGPMNGAVSPPNNTGDGLRMAMAQGCALGNMAEAWWVPIVQIPGDLIGGRPRSRSVRRERTRPRSIMVNRAGRRFVNEACDYISMAGAFHYLDPREGYINESAWIVFDSVHLARYGFLGVEPGGAAPDWFSPSSDLPQLAKAIGVDPEGLVRAVDSWNKGVADGTDPDFGRGTSAYDGFWGDEEGSSIVDRTLGPIDTRPFYAVPVSVGALGTKGGPLTDENAQVQHVDGRPIAGLFAAGNAMAGVTGKAYGGAGGTIGPAMVWGYRAALAAVGREELI